MFSFAKLFADIAKAVKAPTWIITHGITIIIVASTSWVISSVYSNKNKKIESVPVILSAIDTLRNEVKDVKRQICNLELINKSGHDSIKSIIGQGFGGVKTIFTKQNELIDLRFNSLSDKNTEQFDLQRKWLREDIDKLFSEAEKKNEIPYRLTQIP